MIEEGTPADAPAVLDAMLQTREVLAAFVVIAAVVATALHVAVQQSMSFDSVLPVALLDGVAGLVALLIIEPPRDLERLLTAAVIAILLGGQLIYLMALPLAALVTLVFAAADKVAARRWPRS